MNCEKSEPIQIPNVSTSATSTTYWYATSGGNVISDGGARAYATNSAGTGYGEVLFCETKQFKLDSGLVGYWPFDGNANDPRINGGGNGTVFGATLTADPVGNENQAYNFDDSSSIIIESIPAFNFGMGDYAISLWVLKAGMTMNQGIISKETMSPYYMGWSIGFVDNSLHFNAGSIYNTGWSSNDVFDFSYPADNGWHHAVIVYKPSTGDYSVYCDGSLFGFGGATASIIPDNNGTLRFGVAYLYPDGINRFLTGKLDNIRLYNRALSDDEIKYLAAQKL